MKIIKYILILVVIGGVVFYFTNFFKKENADFFVEGNDVENVEEDVLEEIIPPEIKKVDETSSTFIHKKYNFSFIYPSSVKTSNFREGDGEQILFQDDVNKIWFQINITPWDEGENLSVERIKQDLPDIVVTSPQQVVLGPAQNNNSPKALIFFSREDGIGETREVWFVKNGNLYQVTTYKRLDTLISQILSTLTFE